MNSTPWHFWLSVAVGFVWHLFGVLDYTATQYDWGPWMAMVGGRQEMFIEGMPAWVDGAWALSAWVGLLGVLLMAVRAGFSPLVLSVSMFATVLVAVWLSLFSQPSLLSLAGWPALAVIWLSAAFTVLLWLYARDQHRHGVID